MPNLILFTDSCEIRRNINRGSVNIITSDYWKPSFIILFHILMCVIIVYQSSFFNLLRDDTSPQIVVCPPAHSLIHACMYALGCLPYTCTSDCHHIPDGQTDQSQPWRTFPQFHNHTTSWCTWNRIQQKTNKRNKIKQNKTRGLQRWLNLLSWQLTLLTCNQKRQTLESWGQIIHGELTCSAIVIDDECCRCWWSWKSASLSPPKRASGATSKLENSWLISDSSLSSWSPPSLFKLFKLMMQNEGASFLLHCFHPFFFPRN